jgi:hypothetical protein
MAGDEEVQNALLAIHSRLGTIEGKINLVARAERQQILDVLKEAVHRDPLLGQIYMLLDGKRSQQDILGELEKHGIRPSQPTVSRRMTNLVTEFGVADPVAGGGNTVLRKNRAAEDVLNLTPRVRKWLEADQQQVPETRARRPRKQRR